jgi:hypothetical protein
MNDRLMLALLIINGVYDAFSAERIRLYQAVIMCWPSPKEGKLTSYFQNLQRKKGKPEEGCPT